MYHNRSSFAVRSLNHLGTSYTLAVTSFIDTWIDDTNGHNMALTVRNSSAPV